MKNGFRFICLLMGVGVVGCGSSPVKGNFLSGEKNIWISDPNSADVSYCISNADGVHADPTCYMAHRAYAGESSSSVVRKSVISSSPISAPTATDSATPTATPSPGLTK